MKEYQSYKDSGVEWLGEIPSHWRSSHLKYECDISKTNIGISEFQDKNVVHYSIPNIQSYGTGVLEEGKSIDSSKLLLQGGEVLISKLNPRKSTICIVKEHDEMIVGSGEFLSFKPENILQKFLYYHFENPRFVEFLDSSVESVTRSHQRVNPELVYGSIVFLPSELEQQQIVNYLDRKTQQIDDLIQHKEKKIELLKEKRTSLINHVVTKGLDPNVEMKDSGVEWIGEIPSHWLVSKLGFYTNKIGSGSTPRGGSEVYPEKGTAFIRSQNVHFNGLRLENVSFIEQKTHQAMKGSCVVKNDVLLNITGGSIGRCCVVELEEEMNVNQHVSIIRTTDKLINYFLNYILGSDIGQDQVRYNLTGGNREGLTIEGIRNFMITIPPISEQEQIIHYLGIHLEEMDELIELENNKIILLKEYRQSLISEVVTGKKRVCQEDLSVTFLNEAV